MDQDKHEIMISWLQEAYTMEKELVEILEAHHDQAEGYPDVQKKINEHMKVTKEHEERVEACLKEFEEEPNHVKGSWASFKGNIAGLMTGVNDDKVVRNGIADFAVENFEVGVYTAIKTAAEMMDHSQVVTMCNEIIEEEQEMADWLEKNLPNAVKKYLEEK